MKSEKNTIYMFTYCTKKKKYENVMKIVKRHS